MSAAESGADLGGGEGAAGAHDGPVVVHAHGEHLAGVGVLPIRDRRPCHGRFSLLRRERRARAGRRSCPSGRVDLRTTPGQRRLNPGEHVRVCEVL